LTRKRQKRALMHGQKDQTGSITRSSQQYKHSHTREQ
jgi:hypothetical protein